MENGKMSIADMASGNTPGQIVPSETVFEGDIDEVIYQKEPPYITKKITKYSFGFITRQSQVNGIIIVLVVIAAFGTILNIFRISTPASKVPNDVLQLNMERMRPK